jgi:hypothetical protein
MAPRLPVLKYGDLIGQTGKPGPRPILYCANCQAEYSANAGDYFAHDPNAPIECGACGTPLIRVVISRTITIVR